MIAIPEWLLWGLLIYFTAYILTLVLFLKVIIPRGAAPAVKKALKDIMTDQDQVEEIYWVAHEMLTSRIVGAFFDRFQAMQEEVQATTKGAMGAARRWATEDLREALASGQKGIPKQAMINLAVQFGIISPEMAESISMIIPYIQQAQAPPPAPQGPGGGEQQPVVVTDVHPGELEGSKHATTQSEVPEVQLDGDMDPIHEALQDTLQAEESEGE